MIPVTHDTNLFGPSEFESETRAIVMDFMGLVPLSCPPTSAFFKPFDDPQEKSITEFNFDNDSVNNNVKNRRSVPLYFTPRNHNSGRFSLTTPLTRSIRRENSFRTIIRKRDKLVVLEEASRDDDEEILPKSSGLKRRVKNGERKINLSLNVDISENHKQRPIDCAATSSSFGNNFDQNYVKILRRNTDLTDGSSVDRSNSMPSSAKSIIGRLNLSSKENLYVDISKISSLEQLVDKGELSPIAVPLQNELKGLRLGAVGSVGRISSVMPLSPSAEVADTLRAIADQVQEEFANELDGAVGKLVSFETSKRLTFEVLKEVTMELTKDIAPGWARVVVPLVLGQATAMALLLLGNHSVVGKLVDYTSRFLCDDMDDEFFESSGGWDGVRNNGFREFPMSMEEFQAESPN